jgi:hypothetical protein
MLGGSGAHVRRLYVYMCVCICRYKTRGVGVAQMLLGIDSRGTLRSNRTRKMAGVDSRKVRGAVARPIGVSDSPRRKPI